MSNFINKAATHEKVRESYESVAAFCRAHKFNAVVFYSAVAGTRGTEKGRKAIEAGRVITVLRDEGLLVEQLDS